MPKKTLQEYSEFDEKEFKDWTKRRHKKAVELIKKPSKNSPATDSKGWW